MLDISIVDGGYKLTYNWGFHIVGSSHINEIAISKASTCEFSGAIVLASHIVFTPFTPLKTRIFLYAVLYVNPLKSPMSFLQNITFDKPWLFCFQQSSYFIPEFAR
jgi:hypothetical protein